MVPFFEWKRDSKQSCCVAACSLWGFVVVCSVALRPPLQLFTIVGSKLAQLGWWLGRSNLLLTWSQHRATATGPHGWVWRGQTWSNPGVESSLSSRSGIGLGASGNSWNNATFCPLSVCIRVHLQQNSLCQVWDPTKKENKIVLGTCRFSTDPNVCSIPILNDHQDRWSISLGLMLSITIVEAISLQMTRLPKSELSQKNSVATIPGILLSLLSGWWLGHPSEKYESQLGWLATQLNGKIKNGNQTTNQLLSSFNGDSQVNVPWT